MNRTLLFLFLLAMGGALNAWKHRAIRQPAGILVSDEPEQVLYATAPKSIELGGQSIRPLASYHIRARIASYETYHFDHGADISPVDLCVTWGPLSDNKILEQLTITQSGRWCYFSWKNKPPLPLDIIQSHLANMHLIPATRAIKKLLLAVRPGQIVDLRGELVEVKGTDGSRWRSSLSRTDKGNGACEVMLVTEIDD